jgi:hypothetical protein
LSAWLLTGCQMFGPPPYAPPTNVDARDAVIAGIRADLIDAPPPALEEVEITRTTVNVPMAMFKQTGNMLEHQAELQDRLSAPREIDSLRAVQIGDCRWQAVDPGDIKPYGRERVKGKVDRGYLCAYDIYHETEKGGRVRAHARGYFYKDGNRFLHAGIEMSKFERASALP